MVLFAQETHVTIHMQVARQRPAGLLSRHHYHQQVQARWRALARSDAASARA
jgi:hypothetical protein